MILCEGYGIGDRDFEIVNRGKLTIYEFFYTECFVDFDKFIIYSG